MWEARSKLDLIIEVWEKLDCESIGRSEIEAIEVVVAEQYGKAAVDSPMIIARLLADEGAHLRHSEIMELYVERASDKPYSAVLRNLIKIDDLGATRNSLREMTNLLRRYKVDGDKEGIAHLMDAARSARKHALDQAGRSGTPGEMDLEIAEWLRVWLETPEVYASWIDIRTQTPAFREKFGEVGK